MHFAALMAVSRRTVKWHHCNAKRKHNTWIRIRWAAHAPPNSVGVVEKELPAEGVFNRVSRSISVICALLYIDWILTQSKHNTARSSEIQSMNDKVNILYIWSELNDDCNWNSMEVPSTNMYECIKWWWILHQPKKIRIGDMYLCTGKAHAATCRHTRTKKGDIHPLSCK